MKLTMKEKKLLNTYGCPDYHNTVTRLKWVTALTIDPEARCRMLGLARKMETEVDGGVVRGLLPSSPHGDGRVLPDQTQPACTGI